MINLKENISLREYHTFRVEAKAKYFMEYTETSDLPTFLADFPQWKTMPYFVLGEGSNLLPVGDFEGLVIRPKPMGKKKIQEDHEHVYIEFGAGELWDEVVEFAVQNNWGGIENLSLIPGSVGAAAVQNIGAYGAEVSQVIHRVKGYDLQLMKERELAVEDCTYGYRNSIFKQELQGQFIIHSITLQLSKTPQFQVGYGSLQDEIASLGALNLTNIRQAIIKVRESKLPDPDQLGSAGSFFMNPVIELSLAEQLQADYPAMPTYPDQSGGVKLAAAWLIEQCGWKGFREGDAGVYAHQALVLVNHGAATGEEIANLAARIQQSVLEQFEVSISPEVNYLCSK